MSGSFKGSYNVDPWAPCVSCHAPLTVPETFAADYFQGIQSQCSDCKSAIDWWSILVQSLTLPFTSYASLGAHSQIITLDLEPEKRVRVSFKDHGVPADALILDINYTPQGGTLFPVELLGSRPQRSVIPSEVTLWPVPLFGPASLTPLCIYVSVAARE